MEPGGDGRVVVEFDALYVLQIDSRKRTHQLFEVAGFPGTHANRTP